MFSSLWLNYLKHSPENDTRLKALLSRPSIKALSVRDGDEVFRYFADGANYKVRPVCDPAVWSGTVYGADIKKILADKKGKEKPVVGINIVRNGLFGANGINWPLCEQENYLTGLAENHGGDACGFELQPTAMGQVDVPLVHPLCDGIHRVSGCGEGLIDIIAHLEVLS